MTQAAANLVAGVDIGGTKIATGLVAEDGTLVRSATVPTPRRPDAVLDAVAALVADLGPVVAAGVGSAGVIDPASGRVLSATDALPGWGGTDLRGGLTARLGVPVAVDNDVRAHAVGECWLGAAAGLRHVLVVAVGTGVGASYVVDGVVVNGAHAAAGHLGHVPVPAAAASTCPCGGTGHVEAVASGPALLAAYGDAPDLAAVAQRAADGDGRAREVLARGAAALGQAIGGVMNMLDPDLVLVTGGVSQCGPEWWEPLRAGVAAEVLPPLRDTVVRAGALGSAAAVLGAARLGWAVARAA
ncbi:N-acetylmannosamine kinase [Alloactinosynnema sp. L-07]|uniref:ROK family protein n=1 Tax=Alloactinosynnema sp. L-07 TaxID=1653480 RepID=UPI00065F050B|nr:ROK family protein [Alloactinosynnema sp. L-07]CRK56637.1 N-acetylmannosamine kinase [Alloactinosynnema sp. L-07]